MNDSEAKKPIADEDLIDINSEEALEEPDTDEMIVALQAERDELKDKFMRALADAENARKRIRARSGVRPRIMAAQSWHVICCQYSTI